MTPILRPPPPPERVDSADMCITAAEAAEAMEREVLLRTDVGEGLRVEEEVRRLNDELLQLVRSSKVLRAVALPPYLTNTRTQTDLDLATAWLRVNLLGAVRDAEEALQQEQEEDPEGEDIGCVHGPTSPVSGGWAYRKDDVKGVNMVGL
jgi:hypothetical protein